MTFDRLVSNWTDLSTTSTGSSPNLVLPAPMVCDWKPSTVTAREIRDGLFYEANIVLKFFHFFLSIIVLVTVIVSACPQWISTISIIVYLIYYMFVSSWNGASSKNRRLWLAMTHPHSLVHFAYICVGGSDNVCRTAFTTYAFIHVFFFRFGFHPYIASFTHEPLRLPRVQVGIAMLAITGASIWLLSQYSLLSTEICLILTSFASVVFAGVVALIGQSVMRSSRRTFNHIVYSPLTDFRISFQSILRFRSTVGMSVSSFLRLLDAHIDPVKTWCDPPVTLDVLIEWLAHERGVSVWQFTTQFKTYRLGKDFDSSDIVPQDVLDAVEAGRRERWFSTAATAPDTPLKSPLLRGH